MRLKKKPAGTSGGHGTGLQRGAAFVSYGQYSKPDHFCQVLTPPARALAGLYLANARTMLDDPDPEALSWAAELVRLGHQALDQAERARLLAECCAAAGDLDSAEHWQDKQRRHKAIYRELAQLDQAQEVTT